MASASLCLEAGPARTRPGGKPISSRRRPCANRARLQRSFTYPRLRLGKSLVPVDLHRAWNEKPEKLRCFRDPMYIRNDGHLLEGRKVLDADFGVVQNCNNGVA
jgi:hypothetical protein